MAADYERLVSAQWESDTGYSAAMRLATWNVNSIRTRVDRVIAFLERSGTDVLAMQEIKCRPDQFPVEPFEAAGYELAIHGLNQWNGVAIASRVGLDDVATSFPGFVALARSVALDPPLLMYDEPFAGLDPISLGTIAHLIRTLNEALNATSILVTHDVQETFEIVDYAYVMSRGRIIAQGTPDELRASTDPQVVQFLNGRRDGPVAFHYPAGPIEKELGL